MRTITIEYNNYLWLLSGDGIASSASPLDEPIFANVENRNGRYKICFVYIRSLEETQTFNEAGALVQYGVESGRILMYNELMSDENVPSLEECVRKYERENKTVGMRSQINFRSSISFIRKIKEECAKRTEK